MTNIICFYNLAKKDIKVLNKLSTSVIGDDNSITVVNMKDNLIDFHKVSAGDWFCNVYNLPDCKDETINELITVTSLLFSSYGVICGSYDSIMELYRKRF